MAKTVFGKIFKGIGNAVKVVGSTALSIAGTVGGAILPGAAGRFVQGGTKFLSGAISGRGSGINNPPPPNAPMGSPSMFPPMTPGAILPGAFSANVPNNIQYSGGVSVGGQKKPNIGLIAGIGAAVLGLILILTRK